MLQPKDTRLFRDALGCYATGVTVITTVGLKGEPIGVTVNSFNSVSLEPPLVLWSLARASFSLESFLAASHFVVNVLGRGQETLSRRFSRPSTDKWSRLSYETWETGCPVLSGGVAAFECRRREIVEGGDHVVFLGEVLRLRAELEAEPLLFLRGRYGRFQEFT